MKNQKGFSLIELLIVVVIIGIIAAIAIPNLLAARRSANEGSAISSLRTLHGAQSTYYATHGNGSYAGTGGGAVDKVGFGYLASVQLIDAVLGGAAATKSGYDFSGSMFLPTTTTPAVFFFNAKPISPSGLTQSGSRRFCIETDGVIRVDATPANLGASFTPTSAAGVGGDCQTVGTPTNG